MFVLKKINIVCVIGICMQSTLALPPTSQYGHSGWEMTYASSPKLSKLKPQKQTSPKASPQIPRHKDPGDTYKPSPNKPT